jgi:hypothetical protein
MVTNTVALTVLMVDNSNLTYLNNVVLVFMQGSLSLNQTTVLSWVALLLVITLSGCSSAPFWQRGGPEDSSYDELALLKQQYAEVRPPIATPLEKLPPPPMMVNTAVKHEMARYKQGGGRFFNRSIARKEKLYPVLAEIFDDQGVPHELLNLALIESGYDTHAESSAGAVGLWQFMKGTAEQYGLKVSFIEDQRRDPILSTIAAAKHLRDLYLKYKDWYIALAAYNAGTTTINRALKKSGAPNFWALLKHGGLSKQTQEFVPRFIAASLLSTEQEKSVPFVEGEPPQRELREIKTKEI